MRKQALNRLKTGFRRGTLVLSLSLALVSLSAPVDDAVSRASAAMKAKSFGSERLVS
ncbi:MAG: hypothetical protein VW771_00235 [Gammaproteobacteria bacterium]